MRTGFEESFHPLGERHDSPDSEPDAGEEYGEGTGSGAGSDPHCPPRTGQT